MDLEDTKEKMRDRYFLPMFKQGHEGQADRRPHLQQIFVHRGEEAGRKKDEFFDEAYAEILLDLFLRWTQTLPHEHEFRESLYQNVLALGAVRNKLTEYQVYARNAPFLQIEEEDNEDKDES